MRKLLLVLTLLGCASPAFSQTADTGSIKMIRTGWGADSFAVVLNKPTVQNPALCKTADGYISDNTQPGYNTYLQAALAAYIAKRPVSVTVHDKACGPADRPRLIGINIQ